MDVKGASTRSPADLIESYLDYTAELPSPEIFRLWAGISLVAGVLERRCYVVSRGIPIFPSMYILLVASPGIGKTQAIAQVRKLWQKVPNIHVAPDNMTKAALVDTLESSKRNIVASPTELLEFAMLNIAADELGVFITKYDDEFLSVMNKVFDAPDWFVEARRMRKGDDLRIREPLINLIGGVQPAFLGSTFPDHAWHSGFASRLLMIYSGKGVRGKLFNGYSLDPGLQRRLLGDLKSVMDLQGRFRIEPDTEALLEKWNEDQDETAPNHSKLRDYAPRRILYMFKLCMVSCAARTSSMIINKYDFHRAWTWLKGAEIAMPDVFRAIQQKSDNELILDLHRALWVMYSKDKRAINEKVLYRILSTQLPAERIKPVVEMAERMQYVVRDAGTENYRPTPMDKLQLE
jgi:hypothetical protein